MIALLIVAMLLVLPVLTFVGLQLDHWRMDRRQETGCRCWSAVIPGGPEVGWRCSAKTHAREPLFEESSR